jgi:hypothetical protein
MCEFRGSRAKSRLTHFGSAGKLIAAIGRGARRAHVGSEAMIIRFLIVALAVGLAVAAQVGTALAVGLSVGATVCLALLWMWRMAFRHERDGTSGNTGARWHVCKCSPKPGEPSEPFGQRTVWTMTSRPLSARLTPFGARSTRLCPVSASVSPLSMGAFSGCRARGIRNLSI